VNQGSAEQTIVSPFGLAWLVNLKRSHPHTLSYAPWLDNTLSALSYAPVGALVALRRPANPVGWLVCLYGFVIALSYFCAEYAIYALLAEPGSLPAAEALVWITSWVLPIIIGLTMLTLLLFPTGTLPSRRWSWLLWLGMAWTVLAVATGAFSSGALMGVLLGTLSGELIGVVEETMQPEHVSLWLHPGTALEDRQARR
jgi:hypothetical protein